MIPKRDKNKGSGTTKDDFSLRGEPRDDFDFLNDYAYDDAYKKERAERLVQESKQLPSSYLSLVIEEAHYLWPQASTRVALPGRVNWVMTALVNYGVPVVMVATPQFTAAQVTVERNTFFAVGQFIGRISRFVKLPDELDEADLRAIA